MIQTINVTVSDDATTQWFQLTSGENDENMTARISAEWRVNPSALEIMREHPYLIFNDINAVNLPQATADCYWTCIINCIVHGNVLPVVQAQCNVLQFNADAGHAGSRSVLTSHGSLVTASNLSMSLMAPTNSRSGQKKNASQIPDVMLTMPLTRFEAERPVKLPFAPILLGEYKAHQEGATSIMAVENIRQLLVAMGRTDPYRECKYGLLSIGNAFTRITRHGPRDIEIDMETVACRAMYVFLRITPTPVDRPRLAWNKFQDLAAAIQGAFPRMRTPIGAPGVHEESGDVASIMELVQASIDTVRESMLRQQDVEAEYLRPLPGHMRIRIVDVDARDSRSLSGRATPPALTRWNSASAGYGPRRSSRQANRANKASGAGAFASREIGDDPMDRMDVPILDESSGTAYNLLAARDQKHITYHMAHEMSDYYDE